MILDSTLTSSLSLPVLTGIQAHVPSRAMNKHLLIGVVLITCAFVTGAAAQTQDISGGARMIFGKHENPIASRQDDQLAKGGRVTSAASESSDKVDDAIALGNAARDRTPPDLES